MRIQKIEIQDDQKNIYYPHTDSSVVKYKDSTAEETLDNFNTQLNHNTQEINNHKDTLVTSENGVHGLKIETGTFTPILFGEVQNGNIGYEIQQGIYFKINKHIWCNIHLTITNYNDISGNIRIGGLPFSASNNISVGKIGIYNNIILSQNYTQLACVTINGQSSLYLIETGNGNNYIHINETHISAPTELKISIDYNIL